MPKQIHFYATRDDLLPILDAVEQKLPVKYTPTGGIASKKPVTYPSGRQLPNLGQSTRESSTGSATYLVCLAESEITPRPNEATKRFLYDQLLNPHTATFTPGGFWEKNILICGRVATAYDDVDSQKIMKAFVAIIKKQTHRIRAFWVGREAELFLRSGGRLTFAAQSPPEYNLALE